MKTQQKPTRTELLDRAAELLERVQDLTAQLDVLRQSFNAMAVSGIDGELVARVIGMQAAAEAAIKKIDKELKQ